MLKQPMGETRNQRKFENTEKWKCNTTYQIYKRDTKNEIYSYKSLH